jgi:hypothetical protein
MIELLLYPETCISDIMKLTMICPKEKIVVLSPKMSIDVSKAARLPFFPVALLQPTLVTPLGIATLNASSESIQGRTHEPMNRHYGKHL